MPLLQCQLARHGRGNDALTKTVKPKLSSVVGFTSHQLIPEKKNAATNDHRKTCIESIESDRMSDSEDRCRVLGADVRAVILHESFMQSREPSSTQLEGRSRLLVWQRVLL